MTSAAACATSDITRRRKGSDRHVNALCLVLQAATLTLLARIILEWIPISFDHPIARVRAVLRAITEPLLAPLRALIPPVRAGAVSLDLTPLIVILLLSVISNRVCG